MFQEGDTIIEQKTGEEGDRFYCTFLRSKKMPKLDNEVFDLTKPYYILMASGKANFVSKRSNVA